LGEGAGDGEQHQSDAEQLREELGSKASQVTSSFTDQSSIQFSEEANRKDYDSKRAQYIRRG
jgi:hypothetical protein